MKTIITISTLIALALFNVAMAQTDSIEKKPMVIDGKKMKITIETKVLKDDKNNSTIIIDSDTTIVETDQIIMDENNKGKIVKEERIIIKDQDDAYEKNKMNWFNFDLGFNFLAGSNGLDMPDGYKDLELDNGKGCNFNLRVYEQSIDLIEKHLYLVYGAGIEWNNYRFKNNVDLMKDSAVLTYSVNNSIDYKKNKLVSVYLTAPVMIKYRFKENKDGDAFTIAAGPQFGYLINSHTKQKWEKDGDHKQKIHGDYNLNEFRIGYSLYFGYKNIMFYTRYYPDSAFKSGQGPDVNTVSVGIAFGGNSNNDVNF